MAVNWKSGINRFSFRRIIVWSYLINWYGSGFVAGQAGVTTFLWTKRNVKFPVHILFYPTDSTWDGQCQKRSLSRSLWSCATCSCSTDVLLFMINVTNYFQDFGFAERGSTCRGFKNLPQFGRRWAYVHVLVNFGLRYRWMLCFSLFSFLDV